MTGQGTAEKDPVDEDTAGLGTAEIAFTPEQEELRAVLRDFLERHADRRRPIGSAVPHDPAHGPIPTPSTARA